MLHTTTSRRFTRSIMSMMFILVFAASIATVVAPAVHADCNDTETVIINCEAGTDGTWSILLLVINILAGGVGIVAVGGLAYAAFLYTTAADNESQISQSKTLITNVVIGIITFALMYSGLQFLIPGGAFGSGGPVVAREKPKVARPAPTNDSGSSSGNSTGEDDDTEPDADASNSIGIKNFRDAAASSNILKSGVLFRSPALNGLTPAKAQALSKEMGKNTLIIDLRTNEQRNDKPDKSVPNSRTLNVPIKGILDQEKMVTDPARRDQLRTVFRAIGNANGPVLIHCAAGKDRTGWVVAMVMHMSGASESQIMREYMISAQAGKGFRVTQEWMNSGLNAAKRNYGSIRGYLKNGVGLTDSDIAKIQRKFKA